MTTKKIEMTFTWEVSNPVLQVEHKDIPGTTHIVFDSTDPDLATGHWVEVSKLLHVHLDNMLRNIYIDITH